MTSRKTKVAGFLGTVAVTGGLLASAVVGTGAYFSDTEANNHITGTMGSINVTGDNLDAAFTDMLPGETKTATMGYKNTGSERPGRLGGVQGQGSGGYRHRRHARHQRRSAPTPRSTSPATAPSGSPART